MQTISYHKRGERPYVIGPYKEPLARVNPNETIIIETLDAFENKIARGGKMYDAEATKDAWEKTLIFLKKNGAKLK